MSDISKHLDKQTKQQINDGLIQWEPGDLNAFTLERVAIDAIAELWRDAARYDRAEFAGTLKAMLYSATGQRWEVS